MSPIALLGEFLFYMSICFVLMGILVAFKIYQDEKKSKEEGEYQIDPVKFVITFIVPLSYIIVYARNFLV